MPRNSDRTRSPVALEPAEVGKAIRGISQRCHRQSTILARQPHGGRRDCSRYPSALDRFLATHAFGHRLHRRPLFALSAGAMSHARWHGCSARSAAPPSPLGRLRRPHARAPVGRAARDDGWPRAGLLGARECRPRTRASRPQDSGLLRAHRLLPARHVGPYVLSCRRRAVATRRSSRCCLPRRGSWLLTEMSRSDRPIGTDGHAVARPARRLSGHASACQVVTPVVRSRTYAGTRVLRCVAAGARPYIGEVGCGGQEGHPASITTDDRRVRCAVCLNGRIDDCRRDHHEDQPASLGGRLTCRQRPLILAP